MNTASQDALRQWKTEAWKAPAMVASYYQNVSNERGQNRLKNYIECKLCEKYSVGEDILDVGIGTGRASLPLARMGKRVTGTDSSASMLEVTRQLAGSTPITLLTGDVESQPFPNESFDTVMALNVVVHFREWKKIMQEMLRVARPGARIIFDVYSLEHEKLADYCTMGRTEFRENHADFQNFLCRVTAKQIVEAADELNATVKTLVPFNPFSGASRWPVLMGANNRWYRMLSWFHEDDNLFDCAKFLEESLIGNLSTSLAPKIMVVLEKRMDKNANQKWYEKYCKMEMELAKGINVETLAPLVGKSPEQLKTEFGIHAANGRGKVLMFWVWKYLHSIGYSMRPHQFFPDAIANTFWQWHLEDEENVRLNKFLAEWSTLPSTVKAFMNSGINLAETYQYFQLKNFYQAEIETVKV